MRIDIPVLFPIRGGEPAASNSVESAGIESPGAFLSEIHQISKKLKDAKPGSQSDDTTQKQSAAGQENLLGLLLGAAFANAQLSDVGRATGSGTNGEAQSSGGTNPTIPSEAASEKGGEQSKDKGAPEVQVNSTATAGENSLPGVLASSDNAGVSALEVFSKAMIAVSGLDATKSPSANGSQDAAGNSSPAASSGTTGIPAGRKMQAVVINSEASSNKGLAGLQAALFPSEVEEPAVDSQPSSEGLPTTVINRAVPGTSSSAIGLSQFAMSVSSPSSILSGVVPRAIFSSDIELSGIQAALDSTDMRELQPGQVPPATAGAPAQSSISPPQASASLGILFAATTGTFGPDGTDRLVARLEASPAVFQATTSDNEVSGNNDLRGLQAAVVFSKELQLGTNPSNKTADTDSIPAGGSGTETGQPATRVDTAPPSSAIISPRVLLNMTEKGTKESNPPSEEVLQADTDRIAARMDSSALSSASGPSTASQHFSGRWAKDEEPQAPAAPTRAAEPNRQEVQEGRENPEVASVPESADKKGMFPLTGPSRGVDQNPEANHLFKQVLSDARGEGTSQLLSGPIASDKREMPAQASAQASGSRNAEFFLQIAEKFQIAVRNGNGEIHIQLRPENLGRLDIRAETGADGVIARIATESSSIKSYLENNIQALQQSFHEQGLKVERIDVLVQGGFDARNPAAHQQQSGNNGSSNSQPDSSAATAARSQREGVQDEIQVDPLTLVYLGPNSTFHTTA